VTTSLCKYDPYAVLEAIDLALIHDLEKEQDVAIEKTRLTVSQLATMVREGEVRGLFPKLPPSFLFVLQEAKSKYQTLLSGLESQVDLTVESEGKSLADLLLAKLGLLQTSTSFDSPLTRPEIVRPRFRKVNIDFFILVERYLKSMAENSGNSAEFLEGSDEDFEAMYQAELAAERAVVGEDQENSLGPGGVQEVRE